MALKSKQSEINEDFEVTETEQVNFDDLTADLEADYEENQGEQKVYYTLSGKEQQYNPQWDVYKSYEEDVGTYLEGTPEVTIIPKKDKSYDALRLRVIDDSTDEVLDCYMNFPRWDENGYVENITKSFDFYRGCFDFIYSVLRCRSEKNVVDKNGEEYNRFKRVNLKTFAMYVDQMSKVKVEITEGNEDSDYNSWEIKHME